MNYNWITYSDIKKQKYPNLLAELKESGYSICIVSEHMGYGRLNEDDTTIWNKLLGIDEMTVSEIVALSKLFGYGMEYLMRHKLTTIDGVSLAYYHWLDWNKKKQQVLQKNEVIKRMNELLEKRPGDIEKFRKILDMNDKELDILINLSKRQESDNNVKNQNILR